MPSVKSNINKMFAYLITQRRHFMPILSIFFLTLPDTYAQQIGIYTAAGYLASFILEIPSGYFSDYFGHKKTLILSKIMLLISTIFYLTAQGVVSFIFGSIFFSIAYSLDSGTRSAFVHNTLVQLQKPDAFNRIMTRMTGKVSLVSVVLIAGLPFLTKIDIRLPIAINLVFDVIGLIIALTFVKPRFHAYSHNLTWNKFKIAVKKSFHTGFFKYAFFFSLITGFLIGTSAYRYAYLEHIGLPVILVGMVTALLRFLWYILSRQVHKLEERITFRKFLLIETVLFPVLFILVAVLKNPYVIGIIFALTLGYFWSRNQFIEGTFLKHFIPSHDFKATMLSVKSQIQQVIQATVTFFLGFVMAISFSSGFLTAGIILAVLLGFMFVYISSSDPYFSSKHL